MRKTLSVIVLALGLLFAGAPVFADADGQPAPAVHLTPQDIPHCYTVGLMFGTDDSPCTDAVTCDQADATCGWFCDNEYVSVECEFISDRGVFTWTNILYRIIDRYRAALERETRIADHRAARIQRQAERISRLRMSVRHLRQARVR